MAPFKEAYGTMYYVKDMKKSLAFYKEQLGLTPTVESPEWTEFNLNGHRLCLHQSAPGVKHEANGFLIFKTKGIQETADSLKKKGVEFSGPIKDIGPGAFCTDFRDPDGNRLDMYEGPDA